MKNLGIILVLMLIILTGLWAWTIKDNPVPREEIKKRQFDKQSDAQGQVTVEVTPVSLERGKEVKFEVVLDTHSVELKYDLMKISKLVDEKGQSSTPVSWSGGSGGHHLSGELIFPVISRDAKFVELVILNIEGMERRFKWDL